MQLPKRRGDRTNLAHWTRAWVGLGLRGDSTPWHSRLLAAYRESQRKYHNLQHLEECLTVFDLLETHATNPRLVEFALWFHDAVYDPRAGDNEERSAELASSCLIDGGLAEYVPQVQNLILTTQRHSATSADEQVVCDADLAILGQSVDRYWNYETSIAQEYSWVPPDVFRLKRSQVLERFLARQVLYYTAPARDCFEKQARMNMAAAISRLRISTV